MKERGIVHVLIADGKPNAYNLALLGIDQAALEDALKQQNAEQKDVFFLGCDDAKKFYCIKKENT